MTIAAEIVSTILMFPPSNVITVLRAAIIAIILHSAICADTTTSSSMITAVELVNIM
jgi:hypothetical protein